MSRANELEREVVSLRERLSRLSEASLRINESLDLGAVLQGALDSARSLTGARYGVLTLLDKDGQVQDFLSSGMTEEEAKRIWHTPDGMRIFDYLGSLSEPLRIPDLLGLLSQLGLPEFRPPSAVEYALSFLAAPVFHRGERVANIFVADREDGQEFSIQDEETLVLFAAQAALVLTNARQHREERWARNHLETLLDTSPVGVVVFDAITGAPVSYNREVGRLLDGLKRPGQPAQHPPEGLTVRRADGSEISLTSFPVADPILASETIRAEEVTMSVPDGRSVSVLVNSTPILGDDGEVASFIVTLQDLTPLDDLERLRAEFLAMVSDELRMPLTSIKGAAATALGTASLERSDLVQFFRIVDHQSDRMQELIAGLLDVARIKTGTLSVQAAPLDPRSLVAEAARAFEGGTVLLEIALPPQLPWVMADRPRIVQVLNTLISVACQRSSTGLPVHILAEDEGLEIALSVASEGNAGGPELPREPSKALFSRASGDTGSEIRGPDLRLPICRGIVEAHGGRLRVGRDGPVFRFSFTLPVAPEGAPPPAAAEPRPGGDRSESPTNGQARVLALAGEPQTLRRLRETLSGAGYTPVVCGHPPELARFVAEQRPRLALVDLLLPDGDAMDLMDQVLTPAGVPTILLLPRGQEQAIADVLDRGAADYLIQPFSPTELTARIRATLRRRAAAPWADTPEPYRLGELSIDYGARRVTVAGEMVGLTATEFELLRRLSTAAGRVLTHDQLLQEVWSPVRRSEPWLVRNVVKKLRRKLGDDADNPTYIFTEPRVGYRMPREEHYEDDL